MSLLSHYTNRTGLEGIATSGTLWATNFLEVNDTSEYFYAWSAILRDAGAVALQQVPEDLKQGMGLDSWTGEMLKQFRKAAAAMNPQGHMYVFSFARGSNEDHDRRGMLTLWDRYTQSKGYCLQFEQAAVRHFAKMEMMRGNYHWMDLCSVQYGVDRNTLEFRDLVEQLSKRLIIQLARVSGSQRIKSDYDGLWADSAFLRKLIAYCGKLKDPSFEDEREVRIIGCPADRAESRIFVGPAFKKKILVNAVGKHYIEIGEYWRPGIWPTRIVIGPNANPDIEDILTKFEFPPEVVVSDIPVRMP
jgi:Protein of unknown function (DUF2971)